MLSSATTILYDDPHIRVIWHPGNSDYVLVTFADLLLTVDGHRFFADTPVAKAGISCIGVVATGANFYPKSSLAAALPFILPQLSRFSRRVVYGGSMGGYGAIKHSALLGATEVIALCPQWSIDPAECEGNFPGWPQLMQPALEGMGIRPEEISGAVFVFADLFDAVDRFQAGMIKRTDPAAVIINVPMVQHHVVPVFAGTQTFLRLIDASRARRVSEMIAISRERRQNSPRRLSGLIETAIERHPGLTYRIMAARPTGDPFAGALGARHLFAAIAYFLARGEHAAAARYVEAFQHELRETSEIVLAGAMLAHLRGDTARIMTHHDTSLVYDCARRECVHVRQMTPRLHAPVRLALCGGEAALYVEIAGVRLDLHVDDAFRLTERQAGSGSAPAPGFALASPRNNRLTISSSGFFLSAEPDGPVLCNRDAAYEWEYFRLG